MMELAIRYICITLNGINICLHLFGCCLLQVVYKNGNKTAQQLYLINLSLNEAITNIFYLSANILLILLYTNFSKNTAGNIWETLGYIFIINITGVYLSYFLAMFYLTCDRLLHVLLNFRYPMYWTINKARKLLIVTCVVNCVISLTFAIINSFIRSMIVKAKLINSLYNYVPAFLYPIFLIFAPITYITMFFKFVQSRLVTMPSDPDAPDETLFHIFVNFRFFVSVWLITSYLILMVIPILIKTLCYFADIPMSKVLISYVDISITFSDTADGVIYIFMDRKVRKVIWKKLSVFSWKRSQIPASTSYQPVLLKEISNLQSTYQSSQ